MMIRIESRLKAMISRALTSAVYEMNFFMRSSSEFALDTGSSTPISSPRPGRVRNARIRSSPNWR